MLIKLSCSVLLCLLPLLKPVPNAKAQFSFLPWLWDVRKPPFYNRQAPWQPFMCTRIRSFACRRLHNKRAFPRWREMRSVNASLFKNPLGHMKALDSPMASRAPSVSCFWCDAGLFPQDCTLMPLSRFLICEGSARARAASQAVHRGVELRDHRWKPEGSFWTMGGAHRLCGELLFFFFFCSTFYMLWLTECVNLCITLVVTEASSFRLWGILLARGPGALALLHTPQ